ncbi:tRNA (guanine(10)-N(2))-dimethyltransferase [Thermoplasmatales archaeon ex4572_165]|nr:MAG: tRNA (guanine(10)-N(2))-dimethyltransferase [Thermoplasmatales archaeon ex4572_165]RLF58923.1 MAG: tRNA (guanine(10)-N(2))-dimethyltransferase [Thermoplasmata archaeon]
MIEKPKLKNIIEGKTSLFVYTKNNKLSKGPGQKQGLPFYNPAMTMNRDISILVLQYLIDQKNRISNVLDGMAASGIRGFRFLNEVSGDLHVTINDFSESAFQLMKKNSEKFNKDSFTLSSENIHTIMSQNNYDYIDIDPFGSPAVFIDSALRSIKNNGIIAVSATDTATLCGVYPKVCKRRYNAVPIHGCCMHEAALRILIGFIGRQAGKYDKGIEPLLCYSTDHYIRCYLIIKKGVKNANHVIDQIHQIKSSIIPGQNNKETYIGPVWTGYLHNKQALSEILQIIPNKKVQTEKQISALFSILEQESIMPPFYYSTNTLSKTFKKSPPQLDDLIEEIQNKGFFITKTQFDPTGFKTNAPKKIIEETFLCLI